MLENQKTEAQQARAFRRKRNPFQTIGPTNKARDGQFRTIRVEHPCPSGPP